MIPLIFTQALIAWIYFRAVDMTQGNEILTKLFAGLPTDIAFLDVYWDSLFFLFLAVGIEVVIYFRKNYYRFATWYNRSGWDVVMVTIALIGILFLRGEGKQFIYFQF